MDTHTTCRCARGYATVRNTDTVVERREAQQQSSVHAVPAAAVATATTTAAFALADSRDRPKVDSGSAFVCGPDPERGPRLVGLPHSDSRCTKRPDIELESRVGEGEKEGKCSEAARAREGCNQRKWIFCNHFVIGKGSRVDCMTEGQSNTVLYPLGR